MRGFLIGIVLVLMAGHAQACSCKPMNSEESKEKASALFKGTVISVSKTSRSTVATIAVEEVTKGGKRLQAGKTVKLRTNTSSAGCGMEFKEGESMNFAGHYDSGRMRGSSCDQQGLNPPPEKAPQAVAPKPQ